MNSYPYAEDDIKLFDEILQFLKDKKGCFFHKGDIPKHLGVTRDLPTPKQRELTLDIYGSLEILVKKELIDMTKNEAFRINAIGSKFLEQGGFVGELARYKARQQQAEEDVNLMKRIKLLQVEDLEKRLANAETTLKEQSDFWRTSIERNRIQIILLVISIILGLIALARTF